MELIIQYVDEFATLSPFLPPILKLGLIVLVCLVAYLPLSLLAWILSLSFGKALALFVNALSKIAEKAFRLALKMKSKAARLLISHYNASSTYVSFDEVKYRFDGSSAQEALNNFAATLEAAPAMAADRETEKSNLVSQVNQNLENLGGGVSQLQNLDIPELELDKGQVIRKKSALSSLFLFIPLLIAVVLVNTSLLNTFFDELMDGREILDFLPYSIVIALMFTFIELGAGVAIGFQEREKDGGQYSSGNYVLSIFCWVIVLGLAFVEFFLYLLVGTSEAFEDSEEVIELLLEGEYATLIFAGGWLSILGPCIVFALYVFGHRVSTGYYDFSKENDFERFKRELDERFSLYQSIQMGIDDISAKIADLIKGIKKENIALNQTDSDSTKTLEQFRKAVDSKREAILTAIQKAEKMEVAPPELLVQKLSFEDSKSMHRSNNVYLLTLIFSLFVTAFSLPSTITLGNFSFSNMFGTIAVSGLFITLSILAGMFVTSKVSIINTSDGQIGNLVLGKQSALNILACIVVLAVNSALVFFVFSTPSILSNIVPLTLCLVSFGGGFFVGRKVIQAIGSWYISVSVVGLYLRSLVVLAVSFLAISSAKLVALIVPVLDSLSFPIRFLLRRT